MPLTIIRCTGNQCRLIKVHDIYIVIPIVITLQILFAFLSGKIKKMRANRIKKQIEQATNSPKGGGDDVIDLSKNSDGIYEADLSACPVGDDLLVTITNPGPIKYVFDFYSKKVIENVVYITREAMCYIISKERMYNLFLALVHTRSFNVVVDDHFPNALIVRRLSNTLMSFTLMKFQANVLKLICLGLALGLFTSPLFLKMKSIFADELQNRITFREAIRRRTMISLLGLSLTVGSVLTPDSYFNQYLPSTIVNRLIGKKKIKVRKLPASQKELIVINPPRRPEPLRNVDLTKELVAPPYQAWCGDKNKIGQLKLDSSHNSQRVAIKSILLDATYETVAAKFTDVPQALIDVQNENVRPIPINKTCQHEIDEFLMARQNLIDFGVPSDVRKVVTLREETGMTFEGGGASDEIRLKESDLRQNKATELSQETHKKISADNVSKSSKKSVKIKSSSKKSTPVPVKNRYKFPKW